MRPPTPLVYDMYGFLHSPVYFDWLAELAIGQGATAIRLDFDRPIKQTTKTEIVAEGGDYVIRDLVSKKRMTRVKLLQQARTTLIEHPDVWPSQHPIIYETTETNDLNYSTSAASLIELMLRSRFRFFLKLSGFTQDDLASKVGVGLVASGFETEIPTQPLEPGLTVHIRSRICALIKPYSRYLVEFCASRADNSVVSGVSGPPLMRGTMDVAAIDLKTFRLTDWPAEMRGYLSKGDLRIGGSF